MGTLAKSPANGRRDPSRAGRQGAEDWIQSELAEKSSLIGIDRAEAGDDWGDFRVES